MSAARDEILTSVREHLARSRAVEGELPGPAARPALEIRDGFEPREIDGLEREFVAQLDALGTKVTIARSMAEAVAELERIVAAHGAKRVAWSDSAALAPLQAGLVQHGLVGVDPADVEALLDCDLGVSGAQWGIAETGTLVLVSTEERHRLASLVPPVHVCVLARDRLLPDLAHALARTAGGVDGPAPLITFVTGPSRTADIELTLVVGVHGPRELHVILV